MKTIFLVPIFTLLMTGLNGQSNQVNTWVDSVLQSMSLDEKIGQVFSVRAYSREDKEHIRTVKAQIKKYHIGGICFFQGDPVKQAQLVNTYQDLSTIPLLISIDAEWGLGMRFPKKAISFPRQLTIGAITDHQLIYLMGKEIGRQCRLAGVTVNYAPVADINNNPNNPVINVRSFGEDRYNVAAKSFAYMKGLSDAGVLACAKHFPGHGDTDVDSHYDLPVITHDRQRLDSIELFPFEMLIKQNIPAIMVTHLQVPALDSRPNRPTVVSEKAVHGLLREEYGFEGLIITDAMD
ncbi:MAG: beta-N-acetylhexosaminidase, partial [Saprospiraceae bacterium]|nr:beta-N-acetylhexosaminidase [Saprospiraceae bacterium]